MNKQAICGILLLITLVFAVEASSFFQSSALIKRGEKLGASICPLCVQFSDEGINALLNIILNTGIVGGCSELCGLLAKETHSQPLGEVCTVLCDIVGVKAFASLVQKADLDPIYLCELLKVCTINDIGDAKISNLTVSPAKGPVGTGFTVMVLYDSKNGTGTGELFVDVHTVDGIPLTSTFLVQAQPAGTYQTSIKISAKPDPNCDPTTGPCESWLPGNYSVSVALCNGECGSKHPHSQLYDEQKTMFQLTE